MAESRIVFVYFAVAKLCISLLLALFSSLQSSSYSGQLPVESHPSECKFAIFDFPERESGYRDETNTIDRKYDAGDNQRSNGNSKYDQDRRPYLAWTSLE
ncbi:hypothetical protein F4860DRAFT_461538 [Xylaria cubensis]|nr:hypothetical protein F4860DRAFT_461538 [Xylaria cubensis]